MKEFTSNNTSALQAMTEKQAAVYEVESFLNENYEFRRNMLNGKVEMRNTCQLHQKEEGEWEPVTPEAMNSIVRHAKKEGVGGDKSPRQDVEEYVNSDATPLFDPIKDYLENLPKWDGRNHVANLFGRLPGLTSEQLGWCATWLRSAVAHWLGMDMLHGNECVPVLIGHQGCGKSTFALRILPKHLRQYYLDHINFGNKFDSEMALTHNLLVNIDEFANMGNSQQGRLKQTLSKVRVNGRPIFGKCQADRQRYASFLATTNDEHPLCDPTGSRRYLCLHLAKGSLIDNLSPIDHEQLYAQVLHELKVQKTPYWFGNDEVARIQQVNAPYQKTDDMETLIGQLYRIPTEEEKGEMKTCREVMETLHEHFPTLPITNATKIRIGQTLRILGCKSKHTKRGQAYQLIPVLSA